MLKFMGIVRDFMDSQSAINTSQIRINDGVIEKLEEAASTDMKLFDIIKKHQVAMELMRDKLYELEAELAELKNSK